MERDAVFRAHAHSARRRIGIGQVDSKREGSG